MDSHGWEAEGRSLGASMELLLRQLWTELKGAAVPSVLPPQAFQPHLFCSSFFFNLFLKYKSPWELWLLPRQTYKSIKRTNTINFVHSLLNSQIPFNSHFFSLICFPCCPFQEREMWILSCGKYAKGDLSTYQCSCGQWNGIIWERTTIK